MNPDIQNLIRIQALDEAIAAFTAEIESLPRHIAEIEKKLQSHQRQLQSDKDALAANQKQTRELDGKISDHGQKISKLKDQMLQAKTNEQYRAFQHEITFHEGAIRDAEDKQLVLMEESEALGGNVREAEAALKKETASVNQEKAEAEARIAEVRKAREADLQARKGVIGELTAPVRKDYENLKMRQRKVVVAEVQGSICGACHMTVRPQMVQEIMLDAKLHRCDNCGVYLYVAPVTAVDEHGPSGG